MGIYSGFYSKDLTGSTKDPEKWTSWLIRRTSQQKACLGCPTNTHLTQRGHQPKKCLRRAAQVREPAHLEAVARYLSGQMRCSA